MAMDQRNQRLSLVFLSVSLVLVCVLFGVRAKYSPGMYYALAAAQFTFVCVAAWKLGAWVVRVEAEELRRLAVVGGLLITPFALFSLLVGIGPPGQGQTHAENQMRYLILFISALAVAGGLLVLRELLNDAGERFYSTLGSTAITFATPLYLIWATILVGAHSSREIVSSEALPPWAIFLFEISDILLFFAGMLTYLATAAIAASLGRTQWFGRNTTRAFVTASLLASVCLAIRGLAFPDPTVALMHWYTIPGYVVGIPAVAWIMPCVFGVLLLWRAGNEQSVLSGRNIGSQA